MRCSAWGVFAGLSLAAGAQGGVTLTFSEPDFEWHQTGGSASPYHIWVAGDYWAQAFSGTACPVADGLSLGLFIDRNVLQRGAHVDLSVLVNGIGVGSFTVLEGQAGLLTKVFSFGAIPGPDFAIQILETNTVPSGDGAISMGLGGRSSVTLVPQPGALALVAGVVVVARRRRMSWVTA